MWPEGSQGGDFIGRKEKGAIKAPWRYVI